MLFPVRGQGFGVLPPGPPFSRIATDGPDVLLVSRRPRVRHRLLFRSRCRVLLPRRRVLLRLLLLLSRSE
ncbi:hypothetical protein NDU88_006101 [Pleurodeles waltl]|uniref:Uncharacterized protein n=1 Tax=Pleurodeles waltl TaxID=8319 RepID=A0AAV7SNV6_PLEWA|nr:hypothetical protein NDU88_006101 [Pleurodeles waltl]